MYANDRTGKIEMPKTNRTEREEARRSESAVLIELDDARLAQVGGGHTIKNSPPPVFNV